MGIRKKRKEMTSMKRMAILSVSVVMAVSAAAAAPFSYAVNGYDNTDSDKTEYSETTYTEKDTSWFDYESPEDTYEISTEAELMGFASLINENQVDKWKPTRLENFEGVQFILTDDIRLTGEWTPIGSGGASYFAGVFNGNGHTISGLKIENNSGPAGFFGYLVGGVENLTVKGRISSGDESCGGIAGQLDPAAKILNCTSDVSVSAKDKTGGIAGYNDGGTIEGCINKGNVSGTYKVGGIVGENWGGTVTKCGNLGTVESSKRGVSTYGTGGVAGRSVSSESEISQCYNHGNIISDTEATGGIVGYTNADGATVTDCYNNAEIVIANKAGNKNISKSYAGGIAGTAGTARVYIKNCYNAGSVMNADVIGVIIGRYINDNDTDKNEYYISNNYYLTHTFKAGIGYADSDQGRKISKAATGLSSSALNGLSTSLSVRYMPDTGIYGNNGYPVLRWQEPINDSERTYIHGISVEKQKALDRYIINSSDISQNCQIVISLFSPAKYANDAIINYNESKEKAEEQLEKKDK